MRKESSDIVRAFLARKSKSAARTHTDGDAIYLFGNKIAWRNPDNTISLTLAGWGTPTTRDRLNTLCQMVIDKRPFHQKKHEQYYDKSLIDDRQIFTIESVPIDLEG